MRRLNYYLLDNPVLTMFRRSRTRRGQFLPWAAIALIFSVFGVWCGSTLVWPGMDGAVVGLMSLQVLTMVYLGMYRVASSIGGARQTGILDFHRIAPLSPAATTIGFFFGPPAAEYAIALLIFPFALFCATQGDIGIFNFLEMEVSLLLLAWVLHALAMIAALQASKPKGVKGAGIAGVILFFLFTFQAMYVGLYYASRQLQADQIPTIGFFGVRLHWLLFGMLNVLPLLGFLFLAATRMMHWERAHPYSKTSAIAFMLTASVLTTGDCWNFRGMDSRGIVTIASIYGLMILGMFLGATVTPDRAEYMRGLLRAKQFGRRRPRFFEDAALNRIAVLSLCALVFLATTAISKYIEGGPDQMRRSASAAIAVGVLSFAAFSFCSQFFLLRVGRSGSMLTAVVLLLVWILPMVVGFVLQAANGLRPGSGKVGQVLIAICPLAGIGVVGGNVFETQANYVRLAAIASPLTVAFLFIYLVDVTRRKLELVTRPKPLQELELAERPIETASLPSEA